ncbi:hypothetical protein AAVH_24481 [Aphelenchoides avenae]|nr:hypothetical protein AAVH_24481 [Aphelenchus avenae]
MSEKPPVTPRDPSEASFDIVADDATIDEEVHVSASNGVERTTDKLLDVLRGTTEVLAQNQVVLSNMAQVMEAGFKDARQKDKKLQALRTPEMNVVDSQHEALSEEFNVKRAAMRDVLCDLTNDANRTTSGAATPIDVDTQMGLLRTGLEQTRMALHVVTDIIGDMLHRMNINETQLEALTKHNDAMDRRMAELVGERDRKRAAVDSLEKAVQDAEYEIHLLKDREKEQNRRMTAMLDKIEQLEELHVMDKHDVDREMSKLKKTAQDEQSKVRGLEEDLIQKAQDYDYEDEKSDLIASLGQLMDEEAMNNEREMHSKQRIGSRFYPQCWTAFGAADEAHAAGEGGAPASLEGETKKSKKRAGSEHSKRTAPPGYPRKVSLLASNGYFICGNRGNAPATVTGIGSDGDSVRFKVVDAANGQVALKSCGRYLSISERGHRVFCDSRTLDAWSKFEWIKHRSGEVSLRGANGNYLSSAYGRSLLTCNRNEAGAQERFTVT